MPPSERDLQLYTITQLIQTLISVGYELARRFRVHRFIVTSRAIGAQLHAFAPAQHIAGISAPGTWAFSLFLFTGAHYSNKHNGRSERWLQRQVDSTGPDEIF